jgi:phospholipase A1
MARTLQTLLLVLLAGASPLIHAVEPGAGPSACAGIDEAAARLACYDRAVGRETLAERTIAATRPADVFSNETLGDVNRCDKGAPSSLLDARWELDATRPRSSPPRSASARSGRST